MTTATPLHGVLSFTANHKHAAACMKRPKRRCTVVWAIVFFSLSLLTIFLHRFNYCATSTSTIATNTVTIRPPTTTYHHSSRSPRREARAQGMFFLLLFITILLNQIHLQSPPRSQRRPTTSNADPQRPMQATTVTTAITTTKAYEMARDT